MKKKFTFLSFPLEEGFWGFLVETSRKTIRSDFFRKVAETFLARFSLIVIGLATSIIVARTLGPAGRGIFSVAMTLAGVATQLGNLGLHASNTYLVARDRKLLGALAGNSLALGLAFGGLEGLILWAAFQLFPRSALLEGAILYLALAYIPVNLCYLFFQNLLIGIQDVRSYNKIEVVGKIALVLLISSFILMDRVTVEAVFGLNLLTLLACLGYAVYKVRLAFMGRLKVSFSLFTDNLGYGFKAYLAALFSFLVIRLDLLMVRYYRGPEEAGFYSVAANMAELVYMLPMVSASILFPRVSEMGDKAEKWALVRKTNWAVGALLLAGLVFLAMAGQWMIGAFYGHSFLPSAGALLWLLPGIFFLGLETVMVQYLNSLGFPESVLWSWALVTAVNILSNFWLIPRWGMIGASFSSSVCYTLIFLLVYAITRKSLSRK